MTAKNKKRILLTVAAAVLVALVIGMAWDSTVLELNTYTVRSARLPESFTGFRIAHVSDLHNREIGKNNETLLATLRDAHPDMIAITGDLIDSRNTDIGIALGFVREAVSIAPCYYVTGNHEARVDAYSELKDGLEDAGVTVLEDAETEISIAGKTITLIGVNDPSYRTDYLFGDSETVMDATLEGLCADHEGYTVLLSHRPELFDTYAAHGIDLILSGHAHGGQFRLPLLGGLVAPNQGLLPKYDAGIYTEGSTSMLVSRGIGNSILPFRLNNPPEVILIELQAK